MMTLSAEAYEQLLNPTPYIRYYFLTCHQAHKSATGQATNSIAALSHSEHIKQR